MASYLELRRLFKDSDLSNKVITATIVYAQELLDATPTANDKAWAASVFSNPDSEGKKILMGVLAINKSATVVQIQAATDAQIQTNVNTVAPAMVAAFGGV
tara:strand:+ start:7765 stop:8067 length:303 start_codon:yes stop_codon:yes gene_type:complete